eukprot:10524679-Alexandrium_andersonii.AAC.1
MASGTESWPCPPPRLPCPGRCCGVLQNATMRNEWQEGSPNAEGTKRTNKGVCLLYTSDAADDM